MADKHLTNIQTGFHCEKFSRPIKHSCSCNHNSWCICCDHIEFPAVWRELREQQELCDGVIRLKNGDRIKVHRAILSASSSYFKASFTYNSASGEVNDAVINVDVTRSIINSILDYVYTGKCEITWNNVEDLLAASDRYDVVGLVRLCCQFLLSELNPDNCIGIYLYAKHYFCTELERCALDFILTSFCDVARESEELDKIPVEELFAILNDEHLNVKSEETVFEVIRRWVEHDMRERSEHLPKLLTCVQFGLMGYRTFKERFMSWSPIKDNPECQRVILPLSSRPRVPYQVIMVVGGWTNGSPTDIIEIYDTKADVWLQLRFTDSRRAYHGVCTIDQKVYVLGGFDGSTHFNSMRCYDPVTYQWEEKACMYQPRCYVSVVVLDKKIYALGGYNGHTRLDTVERYDPERNQWEMVAPMRRLRSDAGAAAMGNQIYVVGGFNGNEVLNSCEMYNPTTNSWTLISLMLSPRSGVGLVACNDALYAIGGFSGHHRLRSVEKYSLKDPTWNFVADMICPRSNFASVVIENTIYVIGGFNGTNTISFVESYEPKRNTCQ
ncbi:kelch-like protein 10 isoform X2 [Hermetia illucens]|uniref:kelch-like protein 10 isoform X2 n=1 Tax=Hermetia illucens TaxID=343691 RepID=UPI0018CC1255|nr:kelch-like protein 10 isoform X2 [Hermetia illucens]